MRHSTHEIVEMTPAIAAELAPAIAAINPWAKLQISQQSILTMLTADKPDHLRRAIIAGDRPVGAIVLHLDWLLGPYLRHLSVVRDRDTGIGSSAIKWLLQYTREQNQPNLWLCVSEFNDRAQQFYLRHGFTAVATLKDLVIPDENEILMRHRLDDEQPVVTRIRQT